MLLTASRLIRQLKKVDPETPIRIRVGNEITGTTGPAKTSIVRANGSTAVVLARKRGRPSRGNGE